MCFEAKATLLSWYDLQVAKGLELKIDEEGPRIDRLHGMRYVRVFGERKSFHFSTKGSKAFWYYLIFISYSVQPEAK